MHHRRRVLGLLDKGGHLLEDALEHVVDRLIAAGHESVDVLGDGLIELGHVDDLGRGARRLEGRRRRPAGLGWRQIGDDAGRGLRRIEHLRRRRRRLIRPRDRGLGRQLPLGLGSAERGREIDRSIEIPLGGRDIDGVGIVDIELLLLERLVLVFVGLVRVRLWACIHVEGRRTRQPSEPGRALRRLDEVVDLGEQMLERIPTGRPRGRGGGQRAIGAPVELVDLAEHLQKQIDLLPGARLDGGRP